VNDGRFAAGFTPQLDIVVFAMRAAAVSQSSELARKVFEAAARRNLHLALAELPVDFFAARLGNMRKDREKLTCLRSVLMKPEHCEWMDRIWQTLGQAADEVLDASHRSTGQGSPT
jgi:tyrosine decarboxylase / aspartate 1-decarboxylase